MYLLCFLVLTYFVRFFRDKIDNRKQIEKLASVFQALIFKSEPRYQRNRRSNFFVTMTSPISPVRLYNFIFGIHAKTKRCLAEEAESGDEVSTSTWIRDGVNPDETDGCKLIHALVSFPWLFLFFCCQAFLAYNVLCVSVCFYADGYTPLLNAAATGRLCAVNQLIKSNANVNLSGPYGFTALHAAAQVCSFFGKQILFQKFIETIDITRSYI